MPKNVYSIQMNIVTPPGVHQQVHNKENMPTRKLLLVEEESAPAELRVNKCALSLLICLLSIMQQTEGYVNT